MLYYVRYNFKKYGQLFELVNNNLDLFDANIFQKTQESTILWSHLETILFKGQKTLLGNKHKKTARAFSIGNETIVKLEI